MVQARRAFFATDHDHFLRQEIANLIALSSPKILLDLGCGEGFYTHLFANELPDCDVYGLDISKSAVKYAAKRYKEANFSVASAKQAPFANESMDCVVTVFAPVFEQELQRLVNKAGKVVLVNPGPRHLFELKSLIYPEVNLHTYPDTPAGFELVQHHELEKQVEIKTEIIEHLIQMTPFAWKFKESHYEALKEKQSHSITLSFYLSEYQKV
jgi:23S rRNA (guanine745-N1)-methyltransferase